MFASNNPDNTSENSADEGTDSIHLDPDHVSGTRIGRFRLQRRIAAGAMGTVYEAAQDNPRRVVAIKLMQATIASPMALRRFEFESQLLARLHHPGIAQVFEAGTHDDGRGAVPYFAMEYIPNARRISEYVSEKKLDVSKILALFMQVCDAVEHGHQKGIIHRDLKPANILVDSHGDAKVIDFGVARATDSDLAVATLQTQAGQLVGTLQYMSPEQCEADPRDIDARSDVYALGVVLYQLLCNSLPYFLMDLSIAAATQVIRKVQPPKPGSVDPSLRGDLETIMLKALEKERELRYRSAGEFKDDIGRFLCHEPILARPPSIIYQLRLFAKRNRLAFSSVVAFLFALGAALAFSSYMYSHAEKQRMEAAKQRDTAITAQSESAAVIDFLNTTLSSMDAVSGKGRNATVLEMLGECAAKVDGKFSEHSTVEATVRRIIGNSYTSFDDYDAAEKHLRRALLLRQGALPSDSLPVAEIKYDLARALQGRQEWNEAMELYRDAWEIQRDAGPDHQLEVSETLLGLGSCHCAMGHPTLAEIPFREVVAIRRKLVGDDQLVTFALDGLGMICLERNQLPKAIAYHEEALGLRRKLVPLDHVSIAYSLINLGQCRERMKEFLEAERDYRDARAIIAKTRSDRPGMGMDFVLTDLARVLHTQHRLAESDELYREALEVMREKYGEEDRRTVWGMKNYVGLLIDVQRFDSAKDLCRRALAILQKLPAQDDGLNGEVLYLLGRALHIEGNCLEVEAPLNEAVSLARKHPGTDKKSLPRFLAEQGAMFSDCDQPQAGEKSLRESVSRYESMHDDEGAGIGVAKSELGSCLWKLEQPDQAEQELSQAFMIQSETLGNADPRTARTLDRLIKLAESRNDSQAAEKYRSMLNREIAP